MQDTDVHSDIRRQTTLEGGALHAVEGGSVRLRMIYLNMMGGHFAAG